MPEKKDGGQGDKPAGGAEKPGEGEKSRGAGEGESKLGGEKGTGQPGDGGKGLGPDQDQQLDDLAKGLRDPDPKKREEAVKKFGDWLDDRAKNAADPEQRRRAKELREQIEKAAAEGEGDQPKVEGNEKPGTKPTDKPGDAEKPSDAGKPREAGKTEGGQPNDGSGKPPQGPQKPGGNAQPGGGTSDGTPVPEGKPGDAAPNEAPRTEPDTAHAGRAGDLQLRDYKKVLDPKALKDAKPSEEDVKKLMQALRNRSKPAPSAESGLTAPKRGGSLSNLGARAASTEGAGKPGDVKYGGPAQAPLDLRRGYREFSKQLSELEKK